MWPIGTRATPGAGALEHHIWPGFSEFHGLTETGRKTSPRTTLPPGGGTHGHALPSCILKTLAKSGGLLVVLERGYLGEECGPAFGEWH